MAFGKSFSMAKSSIKEKSMEYLRNVTNRSIAEPQDTTRGVKTASQASYSCTSNLPFIFPATNHALATPGPSLNRKHALNLYAHPQKAQAKHPLHTAIHSSLQAPSPKQKKCLLIFHTRKVSSKTKTDREGERKTRNPPYRSPPIRQTRTRRSKEQSCIPAAETG